MADRAEVHQLQNRISRLVNDRLTERMKEYFSKIIPEDVLLTIDSLSYDIGEVSWDELEEVIEERFMKALEEDIALRLRLLENPQANVGAGIKSSDIATSKSALLEYFLLTGTMPWWSQSFANIDLENLLDDFYVADRNKLKEMLIRIGKKETVRKRIVNQFSEESIKKIIKAAEHTEAEYIFQSHKEIVEVQKERQLVKIGVTEFHKAVWLFILNYLLAEQSSNFSKKVFIRSNLLQLSATYNIAFHDVLHVFYDALEQEDNPKNYVALQNLIREIVEEETELISSKYLPNEKRETKKGKENVISEGIKLLRYFLNLGTLPHGFEKLSSKELAELLLNAIQSFPVEARKVILAHRSIGFKPIDHLYKLLGAAGIKKVFSLIFPVEERKMSEVAAVLQTLQITNPFVPLTSSELNNVLWQFIFDAVTLSGNTGMSEDSLMAKVVDRLEVQYGSGKFTTWHLLAQALEKAAGSSVQHQQAFKTVEKVVASIIKETGSNASFEIRQQEQMMYPYKEEIALPASAKRMKDVVRYLLQYGSIPWWGEEFYHRPVADMLLTLYQQDKPAFILLFRQAMQSPQMKKRFLDNLPVEIIDDLLNELPQGKTTSLYVKEFFILLNETGMMQYYNNAFIQKKLFAIAADLLADNGYTLLSQSTFYKESIIRLAGFLKIETEDFILRMLEVVSASVNYIEVVKIEETLRVFQTIVRLFKMEVVAKVSLTQVENSLQEKKASLYKTSERRTGEEVINRTNIEEGYIEESSTVETIAIQLQKYLPGINITTQEGATSVSNLIEYFLAWNRLPNTFVQLQEKERAVLLKQLVIYMFRENKARLKDIFVKPSVSVTAAIYIIELFADHKDILQEQVFDHLSQLDIVVTKNEVDENPALIKFQDAEGIEQTQPFSLEEFFISGESNSENVTPALIHKHATYILEYFLRYNKLPDDVSIQAAWKINLLLKEIVIFLFTNDPSYLQELFDKPEIAIEAKLHLYDIFAISNSIVTDKISKMMDVKRENDFIQFLFTSGVIPHLANKNDVGEFVDNYLKSEWKIKKQDNLAWLMASPSFAKIVLEKSGIVALLKFAEHKISWPFSGTSIIQTWFALIQRGIGSSFDREKVLELFKRFNISFISGAIIIRSDEEYTSAFLKFLTDYFKGSAGVIYKTLFNFISAGNNGFDTIELERMKKMLVLLKQKVQQHEELHYIDKQLEAEMAKQLYDAKNDKEKLQAQQEEQDKKREEEKNRALEGEQELLKENKNGFYIRNAGLVLLHPFIETLFKRVGLMEKRKFVTEEARNRAVLLLQYLASNQTEQEEHELVLNKILCNVPLTEPIPVSFTPTELETEVCSELLKVVIDRWPKMKNAKPDGIRGSLILRNGVIRLTEDGWNMKVEQKAYDIILQTLPWAFSFIKTGWMDKPLITEWI